MPQTYGSHAQKNFLNKRPIFTKSDYSITLRSEALVNTERRKYQTSAMTIN